MVLSGVVVLVCVVMVIGVGQMAMSSLEQQDCIKGSCDYHLCMAEKSPFVSHTIMHNENYQSCILKERVRFNEDKKL